MRYNTNILPLETVRQLAPAAFAEKPAAHVSPNYHFVRTASIIEALDVAGFGISSAFQQRTRDEANESTTKHTLTFVRRSLPMLAPELGTLIPMLSLVNSHDWASQVVISAGFIRKVCSNGMIGFAGQIFRLRHDHINEDLAEVMLKYAGLIDMMLARAEAWNRVQLSDYAIQEFGKLAVVARYGDEFADDTDRRASILLEHRSADRGNTLWQVYNRIQENSVIGGVRMGGMKRKPRALTNIGKIQDVNYRLIEIAETFNPASVN